jgi:hypothetical protein
VSTSSSYSESLSKLPLMAACGLAQRLESRMDGQTGRTIHPQRGWEYLKQLGLSLQVPRPRHHKADPARQELFKRELEDADPTDPARPSSRKGWYEWLYVSGFLHPETGASQ